MTHIPLPVENELNVLPQNHLDGASNPNPNTNPWTSDTWWLNYSQMAPGEMEELPLYWHQQLGNNWMNQQIQSGFGEDWARDNIYPTADPIVMGPDATWQDYAFQVIRRDYGDQQTSEYRSTSYFLDRM